MMSRCSQEGCEQHFPWDRRGQISAQRHQGQDHAKDVSQPGTRCATAQQHKRCVSPASAPHVCLIRGAGPLCQLWLGVGAVMPYWAEAGFEHELPQLLMGFWALPAPKSPASRPMASSAGATSRMEPLRVSLPGQQSPSAPLAFPSWFPGSEGLWFPHLPSSTASLRCATFSSLKCTSPQQDPF